VDKKAKGNEPRSEFEASPVEAPGEEPGLHVGTGWGDSKSSGPFGGNSKQGQGQEKMGMSKRTCERCRRFGKAGIVKKEWKNEAPLEREGRPGSGTEPMAAEGRETEPQNVTRRHCQDWMQSFKEGQWTRCSHHCWRTERGSLRSCRTGSRRCP
jgi:hypothetical protein